MSKGETEKVGDKWKVNLICFPITDNSQKEVEFL